MTKKEIMIMAQRLDDEAKLLIEKEVQERLEILKEGDLSEEELEEMELYLYASLVLQEFLDGEYEILEEERQQLFDEMEEMYNKYNDLLVRARIEEKVSKKKRMTLELMKIRERLMQSKQDYKDIKKMMKNNRDDKNKLKDVSTKEKMKDYSKVAKQDAKRGSSLLGAADALARGRTEKEKQERPERNKTTKPETTTPQSQSSVGRRENNNDKYRALRETYNSSGRQYDATKDNPAAIETMSDRGALTRAVDDALTNANPPVVLPSPPSSLFANLDPTPKEATRKQ